MPEDNTPQAGGIKKRSSTGIVRIGPPSDAEREWATHRLFEMLLNGGKEITEVLPGGAPRRWFKWGKRVPLWAAWQSSKAGQLYGRNM